MSDGSRPLTEPSLFDLLCRKCKHGEYFGHYLDHDIGHRSGQRNLLGINIKTFQEIRDTFKEVGERIITCTDACSSLT